MYCHTSFMNGPVHNIDAIIYIVFNWNISLDTHMVKIIIIWFLDQLHRAHLTLFIHFIVLHNNFYSIFRHMAIIIT